MSNLIIYHICSEKSWIEQSKSTEYVHDSLHAEGFVHCSEEHQVEGVLERYFAGQNNLIILTIESEKVIPKLQYDRAPNGEEYPHIYGPINKNAISEINKIRNKS